MKGECKIVDDDAMHHWAIMSSSSRPRIKRARILIGKQETRHRALLRLRYLSSFLFARFGGVVVAKNIGGDAEDSKSQGTLFFEFMDASSAGQQYRS